MKNWKEVLIEPGLPIREAIARIDASAIAVALVVDADRKLLGIMTDGDIRRGMLRGVPLTAPVSSVMNASPFAVTEKESVEFALSYMKNNMLRHVPVLDQRGRVIGLHSIEDMLKSSILDNWVVLMAGGRGTRLSPLTETCPKPLLKVGGRPLIETILESLIGDGFFNFFIAVNYMARKIEEHIGDGAAWGVNVRYLKEREELGTAGALGLLPEKPPGPFLVINCDLLTKVNFRDVLKRHEMSGSPATMCVREYSVQIPYGIAELRGEDVTGIVEKPVHSYFVNAGIYALAPSALDYLKAGERTDMPELLSALLDAGKKVCSYHIEDYWLDIGKLPDLEQANNDYHKKFDGGGGGA